MQQHQQMVGAAAESASPINVRPPPPPPPQQSSAAANYRELGAAEDSLFPEEGAAGGPGSTSGPGGNRWPRQETLALLKIRSDMDAAFRGAALKGPLWEEVCRKLGEMGYNRSARKCKEKFENVQKYYKRSKEGRAGRQDGKSYRFFSQLEALHSTTVTANSVFPASGSTAATNTSAAAPLNTGFPNQPQTAAAAARFPNLQQVSAPTPIATAPPPHRPPMPMLVHELPSVGAAAAAAGISFSSSSSSDASESDEDDEATEEGPSGGKKRKRERSGEGGGRKMMAFFEGMMRQVMERQEAMQQRFLEAIDRQEHDRAIREEAWRRQEMARVSSEHEVAAGERATAAARNAAVLSFLQKVTSQTAPIPPQTSAAAAAPAQSLQGSDTGPSTASIIQTPLPQAQPQAEQQQQMTPPPSPPPQQNTEMLYQQYHQPQQQTPLSPPMRPTSSELVPISSPQGGGATVSVSLDPASSRWPKPEVHALIKLRSGLDTRYQESGPKGPLWEEISAGMQRLGYNRSAKRCKEKWENINKYFKKVKERNKKRPEDAKTCPYFHQLDALYRSKVLRVGGGSGLPALTQGVQGHDSTDLNQNPQPISVMPPLSQQQQQSNQEEKDIRRGNGGITDTGAGVPSNGGMPNAFCSDNSSNGDGYGNNSASGKKKPEDNVKELMGQPNNDYGRADEADSDNMEEDEDDDEGGKSQYTIQFQRPNVGGGNGSGSSAASAPTSRGKAAAAGSFLAMVR